VAHLKLILVIAVAFVLIAGCFEPEQKVVKPQSSVNMVEGGQQQQQVVGNSILGTWSIEAKGHKGTAKFKPNGYADITSDVFSGSIHCEEISKNTYRASYLWYSMEFTYNPTTDTLTSSNQPVEFKRISK
jgi:hypothetical protein